MWRTSGVSVMMADGVGREREREYEAFLYLILIKYLKIERKKKNKYIKGIIVISILRETKSTVKIVENDHLSKNTEKYISHGTFLLICLMKNKYLLFLLLEYLLKIILIPLRALPYENNNEKINRDCLFYNEMIFSIIRSFLYLFIAYQTK